MGVSLARELPTLATTMVDIDPESTSADTLYDELTHADREDRIALRGAERLVARMRRAHPTPQQPTEAVTVYQDAPLGA
jgi:hypothetical protein